MKVSMTRKLCLITTHMASSLLLISSMLGKELFNLISESSKSVGIVTFCKAAKLGMLNWGAVISPKGLTLLIPSIAV